MRATRIRLHYAGIGQAMHHHEVRRALRKRAQGIAQRARGIANAEGVEASISVEEGVRPKGRRYARVVSDRADAEWGNRNEVRRNILGRAANLPTQ